MAVNTCSNLGTGAQVFKSIVGTDAQFRSITASSGITVTQNANDNSVAVDQTFAFTWTKVQNFGTPSSSYTARFDPTYGDFLINRSDSLAVDPTNTEVNGFAANITRSSGTDFVVPLHGHAVSDLTHSGTVNCAWGIATEANNAATKTATGGGLCGGEFSVINQIYNSTGFRHTGVWIPFKNRPDTLTSPTNGTPTSGNAYNKNTVAICIDTGGGRSPSPTFNVECGWNTGIFFRGPALDSAAGVKAIGIDMTALDATAPEGGKYTARLSSAIAVPGDLPVTLSTNLKDAQLVFVSATGNIETQNNGSQRFGVNQTSGIMYAWDGTNGTANDWFLDMVGTTSTTAFFNFRSSSRIAATATAGTGTAVAPAGYLKIKIDGTAYKLAYYLN